ncbi:ferrous iron transport protein B [Romboutsia weinsteinii]|uniref:Ferrous iron transport protein B n=1 Tax=Romboutsia weinsteinii TaxID=2020949 RepID=A0A371J4E5_9FIRM|nr:ferrous iron transport protein B [Romboutsia weinsteinii]RDY27558.1 ferrous iron transport protein B [Romboutsia weinsteinii]
MINVAMLGNPNVGKTTVFNALTGLKQHVGNWPGVTIEKKEGTLGEDINIVDLPGIYAMDTYSNEEKISKNYLSNEKVDVILNVVDASNLSRNLYLTTQLMKYNKPIIVLLNMTDIASTKGISIDYKKLESHLNIKIIPMVAKKDSCKSQIKEAIESLEKSPCTYIDFPEDEKKTYFEIEKILSKSVKYQKNSKKTISDKIDDIALNPILAYPVFIGLLFTLFKFTFDWVGGPLQGFVEEFIDGYVASPVSEMLINSSPWFSSLISDGIINSLGGALSFFPLIFVLFFGLSLFEDSGYMSRVAFLMDNLMKKVGLSGKAFIPMVMGLGCSSPAIMATRTLDNESDRKVTALIAPLMTCGAKLPIYALFVAIFFPKNQAIVTTSLYLIGIVMAILVALFLKNTKINSSQDPFILELPKYNLPTLGGLLKNTWGKSKGFLIRVTTIMFAMSVIIWSLSSFSFSGYTPDIDNSFLATLGGFIAPIFAPLGFGDWRAGVSIITGLGAKEVVIATMEILYGDLNIVLPTLFTGVSAFAFLVFCSLYTPCVAVLATMKKEYGTKMMLGSFTYQFALAWAAAFIVYHVGNMITGSYSTYMIIQLVIGLAAIVTSLLVIHNRIKFTNKSVSVANNNENVDEIIG